VRSPLLAPHLTERFGLRSPNSPDRTAAGEQGPGQSRIPQGFAKADDLAVRVENPPAHPTEGAVVEIGEMILADIADEALAYPPGSLLVAELAALKEAQAETSRRREPARRGRGLAKYLYPTVRRRTD